MNRPKLKKLMIPCAAIAIAMSAPLTAFAADSDFAHVILPHDEGLVATSPSQGYSTIFTPEGPRFDLPGKIGEWTWRTGAIGRTSGLAPWHCDKPAVESGDRHTVVYKSIHAAEWYRNKPGGIEQGWTIHTPPTGTGQIAVRATTSGLRPVLESSGRAIALQDDDGETVLRYGKLHAFDANGKALPSTMRVHDRDVFILVDDDAAAYPITIDPILTTPTWVAEAGSAGAQFGISVDAAGDVNGDGYDDVIVGANFFSNGQEREGRAYVYHGSATGLSLLPDWIVESNQALSQFGVAVAGAGDVNNDGYDDVIVGASFYDNGQSNEGAAFVYLGSANGLDTNHVWSTEGNQLFSFLGVSVAGVGDVNGDNFDDVIVGSHLYDNGEKDEGVAFVYYGSPNGPSLTPNWTGESDDPSAEYGISVSGAGDVNNDGYDDVIVGAYKYDDAFPDEGAAFLYLGSAVGLVEVPAWTAKSNQGDGRMGFSVAAAGDVNGDGFDDVIVGAYRFDGGHTNEGRGYAYHGSASGLLTTPSWVVEGNQEWAYFANRVDGAGDINDDGYDDVVVSAIWFDNTLEDEGVVFVFPGTEDGLTSVPIFTLYGQQANSGLGSAVSGAGDVHADGYDDIIVGADAYDNGELNEGRVLMFPGSASGIITGPASPVITTDGGNGPGADFDSEVADVVLEGTNGADANEILVDGSAAGVTRPTNTAWRYEGSLGQGDNVIVVTAVDVLGNPSIPDIITVNFDSLAPAPPVITTDGGNGPGQDFSTAASTANLGGTTDAQTEAIRVNGSTNGVVYTAGQTSWSYTGPLVQGTNDFAVTAADDGGNVSAPARIRITRDSVPPPAPVVTTDGGAGPGADFLTNLGNIVIEGTTTSDTQSIRVNGGTAGVTYAPGTTTWTYQSVLADGPNTFSFTALDAAGNVSDAKVLVVTLDRNLLSPPVITTDGGNGGGVDFATRERNWFIWGTTSAQTNTLQVNGGAIKPNYTLGQTIWNFFATLSEGPNTFEVRAVNTNGLPSYPARITITLDTTPPGAPVITTDGGNGPGVDFSINQSNFVIDGLVDPGTFGVFADGASTGIIYTPGESTWQYEGTIASGSRTIAFTAIDELGNLSDPTAITITFDNVPPTAPTITSDGGNGPGVSFTTNNPQYIVLGTASLDTNRMFVNGQPGGILLTPSTGAWRYTSSLAQGPNELRFTVIDGAGNVSAEAIIVITLDSVPPDVPVITTDGGQGPGVDFETDAEQITLQGTTTGDANGVFVNGSLTNVTFDPQTGQWSYAATLGLGVNAFDVRARDAAGNVSTPAAITITRAGEVNGELQTSVSLTPAFTTIDLGAPIEVNGVLVAQPAPGIGALANKSIQIRYRLAGVVEVARNAITTQSHEYTDAFAPNRPGVWSVQARFNGDANFPASEWSAPVLVTVEGDFIKTEPEDLDGDGVVNSTDIQLIINAILKADNLGGAADVNKDGVVNSSDLQLIINAALGL